MEKIYIEQSVSNDQTARVGIAYILCCVLIVILMIAVLISAPNIIGSDPDVLTINWMNVVYVAVSLALAAVLFVRKDYLRVEYDYILYDDVLEIYGILNRRRRKKLASISLEQVTRCGPAASAMPKNDEVKVHKWYLQEDKGLHCICYKEENGQHAALLELNDEFALQLRRSRRLQLGVWKDAEGKGSNYAGLS